MLLGDTPIGLVRKTLEQSFLVLLGLFMVYLAEFLSGR
jgi:hypothetical protein